MNKNWYCREVANVGYQCEDQCKVCWNADNMPEIAEEKRYQETEPQTNEADLIPKIKEQYVNSFLPESQPAASYHFDNVVEFLKLGGLSQDEEKNLIGFLDFLRGKPIASIDKPQTNEGVTEEKRNEGMSDIDAVYKAWVENEYSDGGVLGFLKFIRENYQEKNKKLLRETVARCQIAFPVDEDMLQWFEEGLDAKTDSGRDFCIRLYEALEIGQDDLIQPSPDKPNINTQNKRLWHTIYTAKD